MLESFLLFCSGTYLGLPNSNDCKSECDKCLTGGAIFLTSLFATISASYALFIIFKSYYVAVSLGVVWGTFMFSLDRYIVAILKKEDNKWRELLKSTPRVILAIMLGIVISKPLELMIFEQEINTELVKMQQDVYRAQEDKVKNRYLPEIERIKSRIDGFQSQINSAKGQYDRLEAITQQEADGTGGSGVPNLGPIYRAKKQDADRAYEEYQKVLSKNEPLIDELTKEVQNYKRELKSEIQLLEKTKFDGLLARLDALGMLVAGSQIILLYTWMIKVFVILFQLTPLVFKIMAKKGIYEDELDKLHEEVFKQEKKRVLDVKTGVNQKIKELLTSQERKEIEAQENRELLRIISDAQLDVAREIVDKWKNEEIEKVRRNPENYMKE